MSKIVFFNIFEKDNSNESQFFWQSIEKQIKKCFLRLRFGGVFKNEKNDFFFENTKKIKFTVSNGITDKAKKILNEKKERKEKVNFY